jgi:hypothetical protein
MNALSTPRATLYPNEADSASSNGKRVSSKSAIGRSVRSRTTPGRSGAPQPPSEATHANTMMNVARIRSLPPFVEYRTPTYAAIVIS